MTASELFGLSKPKREETKVQEVENIEIKEEPKEIIEEVKLDKKTEKNIEKPVQKQPNYSKSTPSNQNSNRNFDKRGYGNKPKFENNNRRNFGDNRSGNSGFNRNDKNDRNSSGFKNQNKRNFGSGNNQDYRNNKKMLDERGIEKNIKNIMAQDLGEKDNTREYNRNMVKQRSNSKGGQDESKQRKNSKTSRGEEFDSGKLRNLKQENKLSNMFFVHQDLSFSFLFFLLLLSNHNSQTFHLLDLRTY